MKYQSIFVNTRPMHCPGPKGALSVTSQRCSKLMCNHQKFQNCIDYIKLSNFPLIKLQLSISYSNKHNFDNINYRQS